MFPHEIKNLRKFVSRETSVFRQMHRVEPEFCLITVLADVDMRRLIAVGTEKAKAITFDSQDCWHRVILFSTTARLPLLKCSPARPE